MLILTMQSTFCRTHHTQHQDLNNMSSLGGATIASFSDLASVIQTAAYNGMNIFESIHNHFGNVLRRYDQDELNEVLSYLGEGFDDVIGGFHARFSSDDFVAGRLSNMQDTFFRSTFSSSDNLAPKCVQFDAFQPSCWADRQALRPA